MYLYLKLHFAEHVLRVYCKYLECSEKQLSFVLEIIHKTQVLGKSFDARSRSTHCGGERDLCKHDEIWDSVNLLNPTGHVMLQQFNIQQLYVLPTLYLCVLYLSENKQRLVPLTA